MELYLSAKIPVGNYPLRLPALITTTPRQRILGTLERIAALYDLTVADLRSPKRTRHVAGARQHAMWELRQLGFSFPRIGRIIHRDHSTVFHGVKRHIERQKPVDAVVDSFSDPQALS